MIVFIAYSARDPIFTSFTDIMLTNSGLVKKKNLLPAHDRAGGGERAREKERPSSLSPAVRDTHTRARAPAY